MLCPDGGNLLVKQIFRTNAFEGVQILKQLLEKSDSFSLKHGLRQIWESAHGDICQRLFIQNCQRAWLCYRERSRRFQFYGLPNGYWKIGLLNSSRSSFDHILKAIAFSTYGMESFYSFCFQYFSVVFCSKDGQIFSYFKPFLTTIHLKNSFYLLFFRKIFF